MTVIVLLSVAPVREGSMAADAVAAAHKAVDADRVGTFLEIDDKRTVDQRARQKIDRVEQELGRRAKRARKE